MSSGRFEEESGPTRADVEMEDDLAENEALVGHNADNVMMDDIDELNARCFLPFDLEEE